MVGEGVLLEWAGYLPERVRMMQWWADGPTDREEVPDFNAEAEVPILSV
jgi:hypothetical protein